MSSPLLTAFRGGFARGYTAITREGERTLDTGLDFGIRVLDEGETRRECCQKETVWVLLSGEADIELDGARVSLRRASLFDERPAAIHVAAGETFAVTARARTEWACVATTNEQTFASRLFLPAECGIEKRGDGLVQGTCVREVRLVFDRETRPLSNLVAGEVVNFPGRWSSYPPHHHAQPEIYHYRFTHPQGYGHAELGDRVFKVRAHDTLKILNGDDHAQVSAPGYGMWYLWIVRHLPGAPYTGFAFDAEHEWTLDPAQQGWAPR
jgi:5-deoxy-glucuronate isomerase